MCKYEMDPASIMEDTEQTRFVLQTDRPTDKVKPIYPLPLNFVAGGIKIMVCQDINLSIDGSMDQRPRKI